MMFFTSRCSFVIPALVLAGAACTSPSVAPKPVATASHDIPRENIRVLDMAGVTATIVAPASLDHRRRIDLILYALPNGNTTAQTIGGRMEEGLDWHFDIQHIGAQTRALRARGLDQAIVVYLEADRRSWPAWRSARGLDRANLRIVEIVNQLREAVGSPPRLAVTLTGHSGGGSFTWGFIDGQEALPDWLDRIAFLDSNYSFESRYGAKIMDWLRRKRSNTLMVLAYDDREIMLDGKKVVSDSGGTWRASQRMLDNLRQSYHLSPDTLGEFIRYHSEQIEVLLHPNPANRILHTEMIGEMNGYMHALLVRRHGYGKPEEVLTPRRAYTAWVQPAIDLPPSSPPDITARSRRALSGSAFIAAVSTLSRDERESAIRRELLAGNIPLFLRTLSRVETTLADSDGLSHTISYDVMPDYLAIGSDADFVRMPMTPYTAQAFCDAFGFTLPTRQIVNQIWNAATVRVEPMPLTEERESPLTFLQHNRMIEGVLNGNQRGALVAGIKKDVVVSPSIAARKDRVAIFGWHHTSGEPIQPLYTGHVDWYVDYSHGIRPVRRTVRVDGVERTIESVLADPRLRYLISDEEGTPVSRYFE